MRPRVLIVEDENIVAADLHGRLIHMGYDVVGTAASGQEALNLASSSRPDVVMMDVQLHGSMSGTEAARRIQQLTGAPIIFVTGNAGVFIRKPEDMQAPGICISKPFGTRELKAALELVVPLTSKA